MKKILFAVLGVVLLAGAGCGGRQATQKLPGGGEVTLDNNGRNVKFETEQGTAEFGSGNKLPTDWPGDAPTYPGATVQFSGSVPVDGKVGVSVMLQTSDKAETVLDFYKKKLADEGWKTTGSYQYGAMATLGAEKDNRFLTLSIVATGEFTSITETVGSN